MKISNEDLKRIIKEELSKVMNESGTILGLGALAAIRARQKAEKEKAAKEKGDGYKLSGRRPPSEEVSRSRMGYKDRLAKAERERQEQERITKQAATKQAGMKANADQEALDELAYLKMKAYIEQGCSAEDDCYVNSVGLENELSIAEEHGLWDSNGYSEDYSTANLKYLFPGKYTPDQLPSFDEDEDDYYSDANIQALSSGGYMDDDGSYRLTDRGEEIKRLLGY